MINILTSINKSYIKHFLTMLNSLSQNNPKSDFVVYCMYSDLNDEDLKKILSSVKNNIRVEFVYMDKSLFCGAPKVKRYPYEIYYRIFAPIMLPQNLDRVLYLDCDLIVHKDITNLYNQDFDGNLFVGCTQIGKLLTIFNRIRLTTRPNAIYLNSGVLLINLKELRKVIDTEKIFKFIKRNGWRMALYDQDVIFKFFGDRVKCVDKFIYNLSDRHINRYNRFHKNKIDKKWVDDNNVIVHYLGTNKPWKKTYRGILDEYYKKYQS